MDDQSVQGLFSQFVPDLSEKDSSAVIESAGQAERVLIESLKAFARQSGGPLEGALGDFLGGKGELLEVARTAVTRRGSAVDDITAVLTKQFKLSPAVAALLAGLLVKLLPFAGKESGKKPAARKKTKPKAKPKTTASTKKETSSSGKKPKKKTATSKPASKKKQAAKTVKKGPSSKAKPKKVRKTSTKKSSRTTELESGS